MSFRTETSTLSYTSGLTQSTRGGSLQGHRNIDEQVDFHQDEVMAAEDFPDEDFDDLPLDELDGVMFQENNNNNVTPQSVRITTHPNALERAAKPHTLNGAASNNSRSTQKRDYQGCPRGSRPAALEPSHDVDSVNDSDFMGEDMDCFFVEGETANTGELNQSSVQPGPSKMKMECANNSSHGTPRAQSYNSSSAEPDTPSAPAVTLTSPPFTYLCLLEELLSKPQPHTTEIRVKAFIVTLLGKLSSSSGIWSVSATISDGTGYLDVELSDEVLTSLLGFSVAEKGALKRDPARRGELDAGMRRCQEGLVDMCCIMTVVVEPKGRKAVVTKANPVSEKELQELQQRVRDGKK